MRLLLVLVLLFGAATVRAQCPSILNADGTLVSSTNTINAILACLRTQGIVAQPTPSPTPTPTPGINPDSVPGILFWYKARSEVLNNNDLVATWTDASVNANHATQSITSKRPVFLTGQINGHPAIRFNQTSLTFLQFNRLTNIRSLFIVVRHSTGSQTNPSLLGDATTYHWHGNTGPLLLSENNASANIRNGQAWVNGQADSALNLLKPTSFRLLEFVMTGDVTAQYITNDRNAGNYWNGDYAEIVAYSTAVDTVTRQGLEAYFAYWYGADVSATQVLRKKTVVVGDSMAGTLFRSKLKIALDGSAGEWFDAAFQVSGYTLQDLAVYDVSIAIERNPSRIKQPLVLWAGTNDLYFGASVATTQQRFQDRIAVYRNAGYGVPGAPIVVCTITPRSNSSTPASFEADRQTVNAWLRANASSLGIVIADLAANPAIGDAGDETNTTYYGDLVHHTLAGVDIVTTIVRDAINAAP